MEPSITLSGSVKLSVNGVELTLTRDQAEKLYSELYRELGKYSAAPMVLPFIQPVKPWQETPLPLIYTTYTTDGPLVVSMN